jgi:hypothetical protein
MTQKTLKNGAISIKVFPYMTIKRLISRKGSREGLALKTSFQTKKIFDFILYCGRVTLEIRKANSHKKTCVVKLLYL